MPTYEYRCDACSHELEEFQYIKDAPLKKCPQCGKNKLQRLISGGAAVVFKGSGFYQTDYRSETYKKSAKAETCASCPNTNHCGSAQESPKKTSAGSDAASAKQP